MDRRYKPAKVSINPARLFSFVLLVFTHLLFAGPLTSQVYHVHKYTESEGLPSTEVRDLVQSADGQLWFATRNGIASYDGQTWQTHGPNEGLAAMDHSRLEIDSRQRIWAVSTGPIAKVSIFENGRWQKLARPLPIEYANALLTLDGESAAALVGHDRGVIYIQQGEYVELGFEGKATPSVFSIERFGGSIYAATDIGLFKVKMFRKFNGNQQFSSESPHLNCVVFASPPANLELIFDPDNKNGDKPKDLSPLPNQNPLRAGPVLPSTSAANSDRLMLITIHRLGNRQRHGRSPGKHHFRLIGRISRKAAVQTFPVEYQFSACSLVLLGPVHQ